MPKRRDDWSIYALWDPRDEGIRYIGATSKDIHVRLAEHVAEPVSRYMGAWLYDLHDHLSEPRVELLEACRASAWERAERWWISFVRKSHSLANVMPGGRSSWNDAASRELKAHLWRQKEERRELAERERQSGPVRLLSAEEIAAYVPQQRLKALR